MKRTFFAVGMMLALLASSARAPALTSSAILNTSAAYVEVLTLAPGEGTGQHSIVPGEIGVVVEGEVILSSPEGRQVLQADKAFSLPGLTPHDIRNEGNRSAKVYVIATKRCD